MRSPLLISTLLLLVAGCSGTRAPAEAALFDSFGSFNGMTVEVTAQGGFAAQAVRYGVQHDDRSYVFSQRRLCGAQCGAPLDSASGTLTAAATDSLFNIVLSEARQITKSDYGTTTGGADMMTYTLTLTSEGKTQTVRADDGTMPEPMRRILQSVREMIFAAR